MNGELNDFEWANIVDHMEDVAEQLTESITALKLNQKRLDDVHKKEIIRLNSEIESLTLRIKYFTQRYE